VLDDRGSIPDRGWKFLFATAYIPALGPTKPAIQLVLGVLSPGVMRPGSETDDSCQSSAEVQNA
jgi:hypothetical protein